MISKASRVPLSYRFAVLSRLLAAGLGGYLLAYTVTVLCARTLPMPRGEVVMAATMVGFLAYAAAVIVVFASASATRAWSWVLGSAALCFALTRWLAGAAA